VNSGSVIEVHVLHLAEVLVVADDDDLAFVAL